MVKPVIEDFRYSKKTYDNPTTFYPRLGIAEFTDVLGESFIKNDHNRITVSHSVFSYTAVIPLQHVLKNDVVGHREIISLPAGGACRHEYET